MVKRRQPKQASEVEQEKDDKEVVEIEDEPTEAEDTEELNCSSKDTEIQDESEDSEIKNSEKETRVDDEDPVATESQEVVNSKEESNDSEGRKEESKDTEIDNPFYEGSEEEEKGQDKDTEIVEGSEEEEKKQGKDTEIEVMDVNAAEADIEDTDNIESEVEEEKQDKDTEIIEGSEEEEKKQGKDREIEVMDVIADEAVKTSAVETAPLSLDEIMPDGSEDLDFEPEEDDAEPTNWLDNVASPSKVVEDEDDEDIICLDDDRDKIEDIDTLGDEIDAACPASKMPDEDSDGGKKRGWRSDKSSSKSKKSEVKTIRTKPVMKDNERSRNLFSKTLGRGGKPENNNRKPSSPKRKISTAPRSKQLPNRKSRSSSIEIISERSRSRSRGRRGSKRRSHGSNRHSISPPSRNTFSQLMETRNELKETRERTEAIAAKRRRVEEDLRRHQGNVGRSVGMDSRPKVKDRVGQRNKGLLSNPPLAPTGFKVMVKNFPDKISESEFFSMFVRKGEVLSCEMKKNVGFVTFKTKAGADMAKKTLNGTKNGNKTLSVRDAMPEPKSVPRPSQVSSEGRSSSRFGQDTHDIRVGNLRPARSDGHRAQQAFLPDAREKLSRSGGGLNVIDMREDNFGLSWADVGDVMRGDNSGSYQGGDVRNKLHRDNFGTSQGSDVGKMMQGDNFEMNRMRDGETIRGNNFGTSQGRDGGNMMREDNFEMNRRRDAETIRGDNFGTSQGRDAGNMMRRDNFKGNLGSDCDMIGGDIFETRQGLDNLGKINFGMNSSGANDGDNIMESPSFNKGQMWGGGGFTKSIPKQNTGGFENNMIQGRGRESLEYSCRRERDMVNQFDDQNQHLPSRRDLSSSYGGGDPYRELEDLSSDLAFADRQRDGSGMETGRRTEGNGMSFMGSRNLSSDTGGGRNLSSNGMMGYNSIGMGSSYEGGAGNMGMTGSSFGNSMGGQGMGSGIGSKLANFSSSFTIGGSSKSLGVGQDVDLRDSIKYGENKFQGSVNDIRRFGGGGSFGQSGGMMGMSSQGLGGPPKSTWSAGGPSRRY